MNFSVNLDTFKKNTDEDLPRWQLGMTEKDWAVLTAVTLVYAVLAFSCLGAFDNPQTYWNSSSANESVLISLDGTHDISKIYFYGGIASKQNFTVTYYDDAMKKIASQEIEYKTNTMFRWQIFTAANAKNVSHVSVTAKQKGLNIMELAFLEPSQQFITPAGSRIVAADKTETASDALIDEQDTVPHHPTYMHGTYFDEIYHGRTAYEYIHGQTPYDTSHPPLGKILIAVGILLFDMVPFGWRFMGALFGVLMLPVMYVTAKQLFRKTGIAALATVVLALDFMHYTQTRISTIETFVVFFIMLMFFFMFRYVMMVLDDVDMKKTFLPLGLSGICMGLGVAVKWNAVYAGIGLALLFFGVHAYKYAQLRAGTRGGRKVSASAKAALRQYEKQIPDIFLFCLGFFVVVPIIVYALSYIPHLAPTGYSLDALWGAQTHMYRYHSGLSSTHSYSSEWWSWPLVLTPIWYYVDSYAASGMAANIYSFGNPAVWWLGICAVLAIPVAMAVSRTVRKSTAAWCILTAFLIQYVPWIFVSRLAFMYYYFPCSIIGILAICWWAHFLSGKAGRIEDEKMRKAVRLILIVLAVAYILAAAYLFYLYYPLLTGTPISVDQTAYLKDGAFLKGLLHLK